MSRTLGRFSIFRVQPLLNGGAPTTAITYGYDPLYRLTSASYSSGGVFTYTYDAVGNRLTQQTLAGTTAYVYDAANRMVNAGAITLTWDANGNLLNDGVYTYTYDTANRLTGMNGSGPSSSYAYNGQGDRLRQVTGGVTTTYTLDLNTGLTQVLADGTNTYLYGLSRIGEQQPSGASAGSGQGWAYHLPDALGSVRQLTNASGGVTLAKAYEPYGSLLSSVGSGSSVYAFTGEQYDSQTGLVYLRARYYAPGVGRFVTRDTWTGDVGRPLSLNDWNYVEANPINRFDPAGLCADCFVFFFDGLGAIDNTASPDESKLLEDIRIRTGANVITLYPYYPGDVLPSIVEGRAHGESYARSPLALLPYSTTQRAGGLVRENGSQVVWRSYKDQGAAKALEVLNHIPFFCDLDEARLPDYQYQARSVDFIGYSGGSQIAYSTATELIGKVFVDNLVTIGQVARFGRGLTNIGRIWDIRTPNDWDTRAYSGFLGWDAQNRGWGPGPKFRMERNPDKDVYRHGAASCSILGDAGHLYYFSGFLPTRGITCATGNRGFKTTWSAEADVKYLDALADFLIDYIGVGRP